MKDYESIAKKYGCDRVAEIKYPTPSDEMIAGVTQKLHSTHAVRYVVFPVMLENRIPQPLDRSFMCIDDYGRVEGWSIDSVFHPSPDAELQYELDLERMKWVPDIKGWPSIPANSPPA